MRRHALTLVALSTAVAPVAAQSSEVLRAAGAFAVQVTWDDDVDAHRLGIDTAVVRTKAELVARQAGLPVIAVSEGDTLPDAVLRVYVSALQLETDTAEPEKLRMFAYLLTAEYVEWLPIRGQSMFAAVWSCTRYGVAQAPDFVYGVGTQCFEEFANQWLEANPRH